MRLPPFKEVIKGREVEDPVNLWVHRPLAYAFVALVYRTRLTPNQITFIALIVGLLAAVCWLIGTPAGMLAGGILLWASAILDGADGILARAKKMQSELGRAYDGMADMIVAIATVGAAFWHILVTYELWWHAPLMIAAFLTTVVQVYSYDYYKELFLDFQRPAWDGTHRVLEEVVTKAEASRARNDPWLVRLGWDGYVMMLTNQANMIRMTNPRALRSPLRMTVNDDTRRIYRAHNYWPMQVWVVLSLCPHTYLMAICAMFDRLDVYLYLRVSMFGLYLVVLLWQRVATARTYEDFAKVGAAPETVRSTRSVHSDSPVSAQTGG